MADSNGRLMQRALACEIGGNLDHAVALIHHLRRHGEAAAIASLVAVRRSD